MSSRSMDEFARSETTRIDLSLHVFPRRLQERSIGISAPGVSAIVPNRQGSSVIWIGRLSSGLAFACLRSGGIKGDLYDGVGRRSMELFRAWIEIFTNRKNHVVN
jgi:hypothetical protein